MVALQLLRTLRRPLRSNLRGLVETSIRPFGLTSHKSIIHSNMSNETDKNLPIYGWVNPPEERGSIDILWSCSVTVILCCWVSVYPNVGSATDKWYHPVVDKFNLFCIGLLGPDFLFGIAFGQFFSARRGLNVCIFCSCSAPHRALIERNHIPKCLVS